MTWLIIHYLLIIKYIYIAISVDNRWHPLTKTIGLLSFISSRWHSSGIYLYSLFFIKKKSIDIEGILKSERRVQGRCQQSPESTPEIYAAHRKHIVFGAAHHTKCHSWMKDGWMFEQPFARGITKSHKVTQNPSLHHTRKLLSHKSFLRNFTASNAYAYDRLEEHMDSDSSRPELHHQGSLPLSRGYTDAPSMTTSTIPSDPCLLSGSTPIKGGILFRGSDLIAYKEAGLPRRGRKFKNSPRE